MTNFILSLLTLGIIVSSVLVITSKNPVISVIFLISLFMNMAVYLIWSKIGFVGLSYILIYIGAITVLFLFIIMMINIRLVDILETGYQYTKNIPLAVIVGILLIFALYSILPFTINNSNLLNFPLEILTYINSLFLPDTSVLSLNNSLNLLSYYKFEGIVLNSHTFDYLLDMVTENFIQIKTLGQGLYTYGAIWLLICGIILLLAMLSAILLSSNPSKK